MIDIEQLRQKRNEARANISKWPSGGWEEAEIEYDRLLLLAELKELLEGFQQRGVGAYKSMCKLEDIGKEHEEAK